MARGVYLRAGLAPEPNRELAALCRRLPSGGLDVVREYVGLPDSYEVLAVVPFGYPTRAVGKGKNNRKPLAEVASGERFGAPFR